LHSAPALRLLNALMATGAVALLLAAGFRLLPDTPRRAAYAAVLVMFPKLGIVAGLINNDNAALLAVGLTFWALIGWHQPGSTGDAWLLAAGLLLAGWTKLTVLLMLGFGVGIAELLRPGRAPLKHYAIIAAGTLVGCLPTLATWLQYGRFLYHSNHFFTPV